MKVINIPEVHLGKYHYFTKDYLPEIFNYVNETIFIKAKNGFFLCKISFVSSLEDGKIISIIKERNTFLNLMKKSMED